MRATNTDIRRHANGSIDLHYYDRRARLIRSAAFINFLTVAGRWLRCHLIGRAHASEHERDGASRVRLISNQHTETARATAGVARRFEPEPAALAKTMNGEF